MSVTPLDISEPFFTTKVFQDEGGYRVHGKSILLNLSEHPIQIQDQKLRHLQSVIVSDVELIDLEHAVLIERFADYPDENELLERVRATWPSAYEVRGEERLRGIGHYMSPKVWLGQFGFTMYHSATVPLNVGLHREHAFCPVPGFREVHTQIIGFGKMQQCRERDVSTLYLEEPMAPGTTHRPMYDADGNYPWHQFETITPSIFMAVEMLPEGATPPNPLKRPETSMILRDPIDMNGPFPRQFRRLRLGVVGGGRIAQTQAMAARLTDRWDIVAGALSSDLTRALERAADWHIDPDRAYSSFQQMAEKEKQRDDGVDAVMITTPNNMHYPAAKTFLDAGIDVICDKPLTNTVEEASLLGDAVGVSGQVFAVCYTMSCYPMIRQAQEIVASGALGRINQIHVEFMQDWMTPPDAGDAPHVKWRLDPAVSGPTSCVGDIGTHAAHLAQFVSGLALRGVRADFHVCGSPKPLEDTVFMMTEYEGGVPGTLLATRQAPGNRGGLRLRIFGSLGGLEWDMEHAEQLYLNVFGEPDQILSRGHGHGISKQTERFVRTGRGFPEGLIEAWANLYTEFAVAVAARRDQVELPDAYLRYPKIDEGIDGVRFIDACVRSNKSKNWVNL